MEVVHFAAGGPMDKMWNPETNKDDITGQHHAAEYLEFLAEHGADRVSSTHLASGEDLSDAERMAVVGAIQSSTSDRILVTTDYGLGISRGQDVKIPPLEPLQPDKRVVMAAGESEPLLGYDLSGSGFYLGVAMAALHSKSTRLTPVMSAISGQLMHVEGNHYQGELLNVDNFLLVPAGGSIDFEPNAQDGLEPASDSIIPWYLLERARVRRTPFETVTPPIMKDSRSLTQEDIDTIVDVIRASTSEHALVTAGLVRVGEMGKTIASAMTGNDSERIVNLTGSKYPLRMPGKTDAPFELGYGYAHMWLVDRPGVYSTQKGRVSQIVGQI